MQITPDKSGGVTKDRANARIATIDFVGKMTSSFAIQSPGRRHTMTQQQHDLLESVYEKLVEGCDFGRADRAKCRGRR